MKICKTFGINIIVLLCGATLSSAQTWTKITAAYPGSQAGPCLVLTDATVACNNSQSSTNKWYRLHPGPLGSYTDATAFWTTMPDMPYQPIFYASGILPDGKMIIQGGEYLNGSATWTNQGAVFDPVTNAWTSVLCNVIASGSLGDSQAVIFPDGTWMIAQITNTNLAYITPAKLAHITDAGTGCAALNNCYTLRTPTGKTAGDRNDEEGWTLLPNGDILTVEAIAAPQTQTYNFGTGAWTNSGTTPCSLEDSGSQEVGPVVLRNDGTAVGFGAGVHSPHTGGCTAVWNSGTRTWAAGPDFPSTYNAADAPASILLNGNVLTVVSPGIFGSGLKFFEFTTANGLTAVPCIPNASLCASDSSFVGHMVVLPTGGVLWTDYSTDLEVYTTSGTFLDSSRPVITGIPYLVTHPVLFEGINGYEIDGLQFNGLVQGAQYGDDLTTATNYPLLRATQLAPPNHVYYFKTHDHSTMGVATGATPVSTKFDIPTGLPNGLYGLQVVANGIPSLSKPVCIVTVGTSTNANACR